MSTSSDLQSSITDTNAGLFRRALIPPAYVDPMALVLFGKATFVVEQYHPKSERGLGGIRVILL